MHIARSITQGIKFSPAIVLMAGLLIGCTGTPPPSAQSFVRAEPVYDYPVDNAYAATIIGTPAEMKIRYERGKEPVERKLVVFPDRKIPEGFWYYDALNYGEMLQKQPAPLVYIIGGTGSGYKSRYTMALAKALFESGHHVVLLPSPTHSNFIVTASGNFFPGRGDTDARDLYRVINLIHDGLQRRIEITTTGLTGYSLGGWHAAFVSHLDAQEQHIGFDKVLLINPPLSLYSSIQRLDAMLYADLPGGIEDLGVFLNRAITRISHMGQETDALDFSNENFFFDTYQRLKPSNESMATTIGLTFRVAAANMIFTSDVMSKSGYIYPKDKPYLSTTSLNDYLAVSIGTGLTDYFQDIYKDHYLAAQPNLTADALIAQSSLAILQNWIAGNDRIGLLTNRDDIILASGELQMLERLFAGKAYIFPTGGHLGNVEHPAFAQRVTDFFEGRR